MTWNANKESELQKLRERLAKLESERGQRVDKLRALLARILGPQATAQTLVTLSNQLIDHAGSIRDALQPFDDGSRAAEVAIPAPKVWEYQPDLRCPAVAAAPWLSEPTPTWPLDTAED